MRRPQRVFQQPPSLVRNSKAQAQPTEGAMGVMDDEPAPNPADSWQPPWWLLAFAPFCWLLIAALVLNHRGWVTAVATAAILAPIGMPIPAVLRWIKHHSRLAGLYSAPLTFAASVLLTELPVWLCIAATIATTLLALVLTVTQAFTET